MVPATINYPVPDNWPKIRRFLTAQWQENPVRFRSAMLSVIGGLGCELEALSGVHLSRALLGIAEPVSIEVPLLYHVAIQLWWEEQRRDYKFQRFCEELPAQSFIN